MSKKILSVFLFTFILVSSGCFGGNTTATTGELVTVKKENFQISVPKAWKEIVLSDLPQTHSNTIFAYSSLTYDKGFANNISLSKENLTSAVLSVEYADANILRASKYLDNYTKLDEKTVVFKNEKDVDVQTKLHIFEARLDMTENVRKYIQMYVMRDAMGYTITVGIPINEQDVSKYEDLVKSFRFVKEG